MNSPNFEDFYEGLKSLNKRDLIMIIRDKNDLLCDYANEVANLKKKLEG